MHFLLALTPAPLARVREACPRRLFAFRFGALFYTGGREPDTRAGLPPPSSPAGNPEMT